MNLTKTNWPLGWVPAADATNGDPNGLLRSDNLTFDKLGACTLCGGQKRISISFSDYIENIFTKLIESKEYVWISTGLTGSSVTRHNETFTANFNLASVVGGGAPTNRGVFGSAFNYILALAGQMRVKDPVGASAKPLGLLTPYREAADGSKLGPIVGGNSPGTLTVPTPTNVSNGIGGTDSGSLTISPDQLTGTLTSNTLALDSTEIGTTGIRSRIANDTISFTVQVDGQGPSVLESIELDFILAEGEFYYFVWNSSTFPTGVGVQFTLSARRGQFLRSGTNGNLDWTNVIGTRLTATAKDTFTRTELTINEADPSGVQTDGSYSRINIYTPDSVSALAPGMKVTLSNYVDLSESINGTWTVAEIFPSSAPPGNLIRLVASLPSTTVFSAVPTTAIVETNANIQFGDILVSGGPGGSGVSAGAAGFVGSGLNGTYQYVQINVDNNGFYQAKSPLSPPSENVTSINGNVLVAAITNDPNANEYWFFRRSVADVGIDPTTGESLNLSFLNKYYFVGKAFPVGSDHPISEQGVFLDTLSDIEVLELNADGSLLPSLYLNTLRFSDQVAPLVDDIFDAEGLFRERMLYMGASQVFVSDTLNPDAIDVRFSIKPSGDPTEQNLWLKKLTNDVLILATTKTLYEISGNMVELPDGNLNINVVDLGEAHPPISKDVCNYEGGLFYIASDGLRVTSGSNSRLISPQLRGLFGEPKLNSTSLSTLPVGAARHGVPKVSIYQGNSYSIAVHKSKIYLALPMIDGTRCVFVYDTQLQNYTLLYTDPIKLHSTERGELLAGYASGAANTLFQIELDSVGGVDDGSGSFVGIPFRLRTVFDANGQPRNRKDTFTLKLVFDSGGAQISVDIQKNGIGVTETDETQWTNLGHFAAAGQTTVYIPLNAEQVTLGFRYAVQLSSTLAGVTKLNIYELTIEYEPRPEQLDYLRILPTNLGTIARKRWTSYAFVIDTLGNEISFLPYLDNVGWTRTERFSTGTKLTHIFYFESEAIATDMGGTLIGVDNTSSGGSRGVFEFYGVNLEECVSEKLPTPTTFLVIPPNDYGVPNRKRHTSYKFQLISRAGRVRFTPKLDGIEHSARVYNTGALKRTCEYFFDSNDILGIDIGGTLESIEDPKVPFEFYGVVVPQTIEKMPDRLQYLRIPTTNFGVPSRKRIRTLPLSIDTYNNPINFYPIVDNVIIEPHSTFTTPNRQTVYHYFIEDVFGTDFGGILSCGGPGVWLRDSQTPSDLRPE